MFDVKGINANAHMACRYTFLSPLFYGSGITMHVQMREVLTSNTNVI